MNKIIYTLVLLLALTFTVSAQTRVSDFEPIESGYQVAKAYEKDGAPTLLVLFPEEYLKDEDKFRQGTLKVLPILLGCETFVPNCEVKITGVDKDEEGRTFVYLDVVLEGKPLRLFIKGLAESKKDEVPKIVGVLITARELPKVILW